MDGLLSTLVDGRVSRWEVSGKVDGWVDGGGIKIWVDWLVNGWMGG